MLAFILFTLFQIELQTVCLLVSRKLECKKQLTIKTFIDILLGISTWTFPPAGKHFNMHLLKLQALTLVLLMKGVLKDYS